jgi:hypothetical protein
MSNKQHKNTKKSKKGRQQKSQQTGTVDLQRMHGPKRLLFIKDIVPNRCVSRLKYLCNRTLTNVGFNTASIQLTANGAFDVDPSLGSPSMPGFATWMTFYQRYRVLRTRTRCTYGNRETFPVMANLGYDLQPYAANTKGVSWYSGKNQADTLLPAVTGGSIKTLSMDRTMVATVGDDSVLDDLNWAGTASTNPNQVTYVTASVSTESSGAVFATGVVIRFEHWMDIEFFQPRNFQA